MGRYYVDDVGKHACVSVAQLSNNTITSSDTGTLRGGLQQEGQATGSRPDEASHHGENEDGQEQTVADEDN